MAESMVMPRGAVGSNGQHPVQPRVAVVQDGARLHYAVPIAMQRAGVLERVYTDLMLTRGSRWRTAVRLMERFWPGVSQKIAGRWCDEIDPRRVHQNPLLAWRYARARPPAPIPASFWVWSCELQGQWIMRRGLGPCNALMGFINSLDPRLLRMCQSRGVLTIGDQMGAPIPVELEEARLQTQRWPGWDSSLSLKELGALEDYQHQTWDALDHITCASEFVHRGLVSQGISADRATVIPYPIDIHNLPMVDRTGRSGPVTVGFVGRVTIQKGAPYFFHVARRFAKDNGVRFVMIGKIGLDPEIAEAERGKVQLIGTVPRDEVAQWLSTFDIFLFPSTCEGSSGAVIEAMASGMPVVTSVNSGTYARDGIEGFLRNYDDVDGMAECVGKLAGDADLRVRMGQAARQRVESFDLNWYSQQISGLLTRLLNDAQK